MTRRSSVRVILWEVGYYYQGAQADRCVRQGRGACRNNQRSTHEYNQTLSERRAKAVADYLANIGGIDAARLTQKGFSFDKPVAPNTTEENMQKNRRVEVYIKPSGDVQLDLTGTDNPGTAAIPNTK